MPSVFDVIIAGGSYAGLSAAMSLGRSRRNVLVIDSGKPCNAPTPHSHNFLTQDGSTPAAIATIGRQQVEKYPTITFKNNVAVAGSKQKNTFNITLENGDTVEGRKLIFATGIKDQLLPIKGFSECWGKTVIHCPYCHGYEFHSLKTAIFATGEAAMHYALLVRNLTKDLTVLTNGPHDFTQEQLDKLGKHHIPVIETEVTEIIHATGKVRGLRFNDGSELQFDAVYAKVPFVQHSDIPVSLGCELSEQGYIKIDAMQKTTVDGVFACGDNSSMMRAVANAVATGNFAGAVVNKELAGEEFQ
jgi:thioredoxin reductase